MLKKNMFFNRDSVNIFTDASLKTINGITSVCPGACIYINDVLVYQDYTILHNVTINQGELYAIQMGLLEAVKYRRQFKHIRLFSDSQTSVFALRDRIFTWIKTDQNDGKLYGYDGKEIANLDYIMSIIYFIIQSQLQIELYHVKGHIRHYDYYDIKRAIGVFKQSNHITDTVDDELIRQITLGNTQVDRFTGLMLDMYISDKRFDTSDMKDAISVGYAPFDINQYKALITR